MRSKEDKESVGGAKETGWRVARLGSFSKESCTMISCGRQVDIIAISVVEG